MSALDAITKEKQRVSEALARVDALLELSVPPLILAGADEIIEYNG